jgi:hypothetical protein
MKKSHLNLFAQCCVVICGLVLAGASTRANAQQLPGAHPSYLDALRDVRHAKALLDGYHWTNPAHAQAAAAAIPQLEGAIGELKAAATVDQKNLNDAPHDSSISEANRLKTVDQLLITAHEDLNKHESDPMADHHRDKAFQYIDAAHKIIEKVK